MACSSSLGELLSAAGRAGHVETVRLDGGLPGEVQGLRQVAAGGARRSAPAQSSRASATNGRAPIRVFTVTAAA